MVFLVFLVGFLCFLAGFLLGRQFTLAEKLKKNSDSFEKMRVGLEQKLIRKRK